jgi:hypothetical protein
MNEERRGARRTPERKAMFGCELYAPNRSVFERSESARRSDAPYPSGRLIVVTGSSEFRRIWRLS